jgi:uncharacterized protein YndB with AHSA1/START domain
MTTPVDRSVTHATFVIERTYAASPHRVFAAFADPAAKQRWFAVTDEYQLDFRIGGHEISRGEVQPGGPTYVFDAVYQDIVPNQRIITSYEMQMAKQRISVSVATIEFQPDGSGTRLVFTEQGAFLDGLDTPAEREHGTGELLNALAAELERQAAAEPTH